MKVKDLIKFLETQDQELDVAYELHSEQILMQEKEIVVFEGCIERPDGWIQNKRPDMSSKKYLMFPGN
jgi:hypothetical protein